jgi:hypothetical protein
MAEDSSWDGLRERGLLSTASLVDLFEIREPKRTELLTEHRPQSVTIEHPVYGRAVIRDQKPLQITKHKAVANRHGYREEHLFQPWPVAI